MHAFDAPPFPIDFQCAMCAIPVVNKAMAKANAAHHANIIKEVKAIEACIAVKKANANQKQSQDFAVGMSLLAKRAKAVNFADTSSTILIGLTDHMPYDYVMLYADAINIDNLPTSA
jgi:hypothetical protein